MLYHPPSRGLFVYGEVKQTYEREESPEAPSSGVTVDFTGANLASKLNTTGNANWISNPFDKVFIFNTGK